MALSGSIHIVHFKLCLPGAYNGSPSGSIVLNVDLSRNVPVIQKSKALTYKAVKCATVLCHLDLSGRDLQPSILCIGEELAMPYIVYLVV